MKRALVGLVVASWCAVAWPCLADEMDGDDPDAPASLRTAPGEATAAPVSQEGAEPAEEPPPGRILGGSYLGQVWQRDRLTGDWGGLRTDLADHGIKPRVRFSQFGQVVATGGIEQNGRYGGKVDWILDVDVSKLAGIWPGLSINLHAETQYGKSVFTDVGPSALPSTPMLLPLPNCDCTEVTNLTLTQGLWEGAIPLQEDKGAVVLSAGMLNIVDLLTTSFPNFASGLEGFLNYNALYPAWPYLRFWFLSQYGASLALFNEDRGMPQVSFLVYGQDNVSNKWSMRDSFNDGVGIMGLFRVFWDLGDKMGYAAVLASGSTKEYSVVDSIVWTQPFRGAASLPSLGKDQGKPWQVNPFLYQEFWRGAGGGKDERKAYLWLTGAVADESPSFARWSVLGTVEALGLLASRPMDRMGLAGWYTAWNDSFKDELRGLGGSPRDVFGFELYYNLAINPWLHLTADLQLVQNLDKQFDFAVIPGARLVMEF